MNEGLFFGFTEDLSKFQPKVLQVDGHEAIGALFEYTIHLSVEEPLADADIDDLLTKPVQFTLDDGGSPIHGVVREVELAEHVEARAPQYRLTVVPSVWLLTLSRISRVYQNVTVLDIAREILMRFSMKEMEDFIVRTFGSYETRELYVQYEESDWAFLSRWFEREGLYYWFEHTEDGDQLIISDSNKGFDAISGDSKVPYRDSADLGREDESIQSWSGRRGRSVTSVILKDYNERNPALPMVARSDADTKTGFGVIFTYGEHFADPAAGKTLAQKRTERIMVERVTSRGRCDSGRFHAGFKFEMIDHFVSSQNGEYVLTQVSHNVRRPEIDRENHPEVDENDFVHTAVFDAIPLATQFRPARTTPWPRIDGVLTGHIDSDTAGEFSTLNEESRYRVRLPFDSTGNEGEKCLSWVRMVQAYSGAAYGTHYPLHKGAEVMLAFVGGNPDRPIIVGAIPNAHTPGPSASKNATQSVTHTASGVRFVLDDEIDQSPPA
jgi:type VI secretion system secreted protein VgrG